MYFTKTPLYFLCYYIVVIDFNFANTFPSVSFEEKNNKFELIRNYEQSKALRLFGRIPSVLTEEKTIKNIISSLANTHFEVSRFFSLLNFVYYTYFTNERLFSLTKEKIKKRFLSLYGQNPFLDNNFLNIHRNIYGKIIEILTSSVIKNGISIFTSKISVNLTKTENKSLCANENYNEQIRKFFYRIKSYVIDVFNEEKNRILREMLFNAGNQLTEIDQSGEFVSFYSLYAVSRKNAIQTYFSKDFFIDPRKVVEEKYLETLNNIKVSEEIRNVLYNYFADWVKVDVYLNTL